MTEVPWVAILSSSVLGGAVGALVTGYFALSAKRKEFLNAYYKTVIDRRIAAYEQLEKLIITLKTSVLDSDNRPYHFLFSSDDDWETVYKLMFDVISQSLWLSHELFLRIRELTDLVYRDHSEKGGVIEFGKQNYQRIATLREKIEHLHADDMLRLYDVKMFLKSKKAAIGGFREFPRVQPRSSDKHAKNG